jgi:nucleotide-binding universal stress UspA family protein
MFQKILVAVDGSVISEAAFGEALDLARQTGATLMLLHVLLPDERSLPTVYYYYPIVSSSIANQYQERWEAEIEHGLAMLRSLAQRASRLGVRVEFTQNIGDPGRLICEIAADWKADLIILGRRGYTGFNEFFLGSVSNYVTHHAPCSVLTVQHSTLSPEMKAAKTTAV